MKIIKEQFKKEDKEENHNKYNKELLNLEFKKQELAINNTKVLNNGFLNLKLNFHEEIKDEIQDKIHEEIIKEENNNEQINEILIIFQDIKKQCEELDDGEIKDEESDDEEIKDKELDDEEIKEKIKKQLKEELKDEVKAQLKEELEEQIKGELLQKFEEESNTEEKKEKDLSLFQLPSLTNLSEKNCNNNNNTLSLSFALFPSHFSVCSINYKIAILGNNENDVLVFCNYFTDLDQPNYTSTFPSSSFYPSVIFHIDSAISSLKEDIMVQFHTEENDKDQDQNQDENETTNDFIFTNCDGIIIVCNKNEELSAELIDLLEKIHSTSNKKIPIIVCQNLLKSVKLRTEEEEIDSKDEIYQIEKEELKQLRKEGEIKDEEIDFFIIDLTKITAIGEIADCCTICIDDQVNMDKPFVSLFAHLNDLDKDSIHFKM